MLFKNVPVFQNGSLSFRSKPNVGASSRVVTAQRSLSGSALERLTSGITPFAETQDTVGFGASPFVRTLDGIAPQQYEEAYIRLYRDIYYYDSIGGSACDLMSSFPYSDFTLSGVDNKVQNVYMEAMSRLNMRSLIREITLHYLVDGAYCGTLIYDPTIRNFSDIFAHDREYLRVLPSPMYKLPPIIQTTASPRMRMFMQSTSKYRDQLLHMYENYSAIRNSMKEGWRDLNPLVTLYVERRGLIDSLSGSASYLKRLIPSYMLEKVLYRGTLIEAAKRQRATSHIQVGDGEWEPTLEEMRDILTQFQTTETDPLGAWIVTRQGVTVNDVRQAGDIWKWTDTQESLVNIKLRALGISEAFLSGDAAYATAESAVTTFMENAEAQRAFMTHRVFTSTLFPLIAIANGLYRAGNDQHKTLKDPADIMFDLSNHKNLDLPRLYWQKDLAAGDKPSRMDLLEKLAEHGFPIAFRSFAGAAGLDIGVLINDLREDIRVSEMLKVIKEEAGGQFGLHSDGGDGGSDSGDMFANASKETISRLTSALTSGLQQKSLLSRKMPDPEVSVTSRTGKKKAVLSGEHRHQKKENERILKALRNIDDPEHREKVRRKIIAKRGGIPNIMNGGFL